MIYDAPPTQSPRAQAAPPPPNPSSPFTVPSLQQGAPRISDSGAGAAAAAVSGAAASAFIDSLDVTFNATPSVVSTSPAAAPPRQPAVSGAGSVSVAVAGAVPEAGSLRRRSSSDHALPSPHQPSQPALWPPAPPHGMSPRGVPSPISTSVAGAASASVAALAPHTAAADALLQTVQPPPPAAPPCTSPTAAPLDDPHQSAACCRPSASVSGSGAVSGALAASARCMCMAPAEPRAEEASVATRRAATRKLVRAREAAERGRPT